MTVPTNLKLISSGNTPNTTTLSKGEMAFGKVPTTGNVRLFVNDDGLSVKELPLNYGSGNYVVNGNNPNNLSIVTPYTFIIDGDDLQLAGTNIEMETSSVNTHIGISSNNNVDLNANNNINLNSINQINLDGYEVSVNTVSGGKAYYNGNEIATVNQISILSKLSPIFSATSTQNWSLIPNQLLIGSGNINVNFPTNVGRYRLVVYNTSSILNINLNYGPTMFDPF